MPERFRYHSDEHPPEDAFEAYRRLYAAGCDVSRGSGPFVAEIRGWRLDKILLFDRRLTGAIHTREVAHRADGFDHFVLTLVVEGELRGVGKVSPFSRIGAGQIVLLDTLKPTSHEPLKSRLITASIARDLAEAAFGDLETLHGRIMAQPHNYLLADFLEVLVRRAPIMTPACMAGAARALINILATASDIPDSSGWSRQLDIARREAVDRLIAERIADRHLAAPAICHATGISRSSLYRLLAKGGGVAQYVTRERLDAVRKALDDGDRRTLSELALACGFAGESHMSRQFQAVYGMRPGAYRQTVVDAADAETDLARRRWAGWMIEVK